MTARDKYCPCEKGCDCGAYCNLIHLVLDTNIFSLVTSLSACLATRETHRGIFNLQGRPSLFHNQHSSGEGNRTKSNAVYHSGNDLE